MAPLVLATVAWLGYELGKTRPGGSFLFKKRKTLIDASLSVYEKGEVKNALLHQTDPEALHVMALALKTKAPIASDALEAKSVALTGIAKGEAITYSTPDFDYK